MSKIKWLIIVPFAAIALAGCPGSESKPSTEPKPGSEKPSTPSTSASATERPQGVVGYYRLDDPATYGATVMKDVPKGQIRYLGINKTQWVMRDMMVGFGGTWSETKEGAILTVKTGPSGPTSGNETILAVRTEKGIELRNPKTKESAGEFTFVSPEAPAGFSYE